MEPRMIQGLFEELLTLEKDAAWPAMVERAVGFFANKVKNPSRMLGMMGIKQVNRGGLSGAGKLLGNPAEFLPRLQHPIQGMREGYRQLSPVNQIAKGLKELNEHPEIKAKGLNFASVQEAQKALGPKHPLIKDVIGSGLTGARHPGMLEPSRTLREAYRTGGLKGGAEELSRRGWTGETRFTKYLPVGGKSWIPGMGAMAIPGMVNAPKPSKAGEGSTLERGMGAVADMGSMALMGGLGMVPGTLGWLATSKAARGTGRVLDRLRAGATVDQALHAPSPTEAMQQLDRIKKTYG